MCGIQGLYLPQSQINPKYLTNFKQALSTIAHRGPDGENVLQLSNLWLGHRRLSILDLNERAAQPMSVSAAPVKPNEAILCYNGEIYNYLELKEELSKLGHLFQTTSDSEVLAKAYLQWGVDCFSKFNGMWACALWDTAQKKLILSRDRFGVKPLFYTKTEAGLFWGSEIKQLLHFRKSVSGISNRFNHYRLYEYLEKSLVHHSEDTLYDEIYQIRPSTYVVLSEENFNLPHFHESQKKYWDFPESETYQNTEKEFYKAASTLRELLHSSVKLRLRSDVPVGSALSGGIDSASIVRILSTMQPLKQKTVTASFPNTPIDEGKFARIAVKNLNVDFIETFPKPENLAAQWSALNLSLDGILGSTSMYAQREVFKTAHANGLKVMLDGQGSDEIFCGYEGFFRKVVQASSLKESLLFLKENRNYFVKKLKRKFQTRKNLIDNLNFKNIESYADLNFGKRNAFYKDPLKEALYRSTVFSSLPALLQYEDRNSMAFSIESRTPFLDYRVVELAFSCPSRFHVRNGLRKSLLREAMRELVPHEILFRKDKIGFETPEQQWKSSLKSSLLKNLINTKEQKIFNSDSLRKELDQGENWKLLSVLESIKNFELDTSL